MAAAQDFTFMSLIIQATGRWPESSMARFERRKQVFRSSHTHSIAHFPILPV